jgi:hypothetical protein
MRMVIRKQRRIGWLMEIPLIYIFCGQTKYQTK